MKESFWFMTGLFRVIFQFLWGRFNSIFFWTFVVWKLNWVILSSSGSFITWKAYSNTPMFLDHVPDCFPAKFRNKSTNKNKGTRTSTRLFLTTVCSWTKDKQKGRFSLRDKQTTKTLFFLNFRDKKTWFLWWSTKFLNKIIRI